MSLFFLAQAAGKAYDELAAHPSMQRSLVNPFDIGLLKEAGNYFWPFDSAIINVGVLLIFAAAFLFWCSFRVNRSYVYHILSWSIAILGLNFLAFFRTPFPGLLAVMIAAFALLVIHIDLTIILTVAAIRYLPYVGIEERMLTHIKDGSVTNYTMAGASLASLGIMWLSLSCSRVYLTALFNHSSWPFWVISILLVPLGAIVARELLPWTLLKEHPLPGGGYLREITNIFIKDGDAERKEIIAAGVSLCVVFISLIWLFQGKITDTDIFGIICIGFLCVIMIRAELNKSIKEDVIPRDEIVRRKKDAWS
ncbi:MAG: hypothetical protein ACI38Q_00280 [Candidatus Bruticola sp.]